MNSYVTQIQQHCIEQGWTLSLAESCTGGSLAARITTVPGCSKYFLGSIVVYSNALKINLLGISSDILVKYGAVSEEVVLQMAQGVNQLTGSDISVAVSGIAGPGGGTELKPVGTIWGAIVKKGDDPYVWNFFLKGNRQEIIQKTVDILLQQLWSLIKSKKKFMNE